MTEPTVPPLPPPPVSPARPRAIFLALAGAGAVAALALAAFELKGLDQDAQTPIEPPPTNRAPEEVPAARAGMVVTSDTCAAWGAKAGALYLREMTYANPDSGPLRAVNTAGAKTQEDTFRNKCAAEAQGKRIPPRIVRCFESEASTLAGFSACFGVAMATAK